MGASGRSEGQTLADAQHDGIGPMRPVDLGMPDGSWYLGFEVPEACTVARWVIFMERGGTGDKVLYARKIRCYKDPERRLALESLDVLPARPAPVFVGGPGSVVAMLELALRRWVGPAVPTGRFFACASQRCGLLVCSRAAVGGYCCVQCCRGSSHGPQCEQIAAPGCAPKAPPTWMPDDPSGKYADAFVTHADLRKDDEEWVQPTGEAKVKQRALVEKMGVYIGPYVDFSQTSAVDCITLSKSIEHRWSLDYDPNFICELLYEGFYTRGLEFALQHPPVQIMVASWDKKMSVWDFDETHISRQVRKRAKQFTLTVDAAFDDVLLGCVREHGENWLFRGWRWMVRKLYAEGYTGTKGISVSVHSFELWDQDSKLAAGDIGSFVGGVYTSMTGFHERHTRSAGEVQMMLTASWLHRMGFKWVDLGQVLPYKASLGAKVVARQEYLQRLHGDRDEQPSVTIDSRERLQGRELLAHLSQVVGSRPEAGKKKAPKRRPQRRTAPAPEPPQQRAGERDRRARGSAGELSSWKAAAELAEELRRKPPSCPATGGGAAHPGGGLRGLAAGPRPSDGQVWEVVGGKDKGGIIVRYEESTSSAAIPTRLSTGSRVEQLSVAGNRLHYRKIAGDGPESGWVSIRYEDRALVQPRSGGTRVVGSHYAPSPV